MDTQYVHGPFKYWFLLINLWKFYENFVNMIGFWTRLKTFLTHTHTYTDIYIYIYTYIYRKCGQHFMI